MWPAVVKWQDEVDSWGLCDALAKIYTKILVVMPGEVYAQLKRWNKDPNLWKRRQSVVSLLYYSRTQEQHLPYEKIVPLIDELISDKEHFVQKGVGWALRELRTAYPRQAASYLARNARSLTSIAFAIAVEKLSDAERSRLKDLRKRESMRD